MNEAETRAERCPALAAAGWGVVEGQSPNSNERGHAPTTAADANTLEWFHRD